MALSMCYGLCMELPLYNKDGLVGYTTISDEDKYLAGWRWSLKDGYVVRGGWADGKCCTIRMHREVLGLEKGDKRQGDHINHDKLDNRRENLRIVTCSENQQNRKGANRGSRSNHWGVHWHRKSGKWQAQVTLNRKHFYLGVFDSEEEAAAVSADFRARHYIA